MEETKVLNKRLRFLILLIAFAKRMKISHLPNSLPLNGAVRIELVEGVPIFRASSLVQGRIEVLLTKQKESALTSEEEKELDEYE